MSGAHTAPPTWGIKWTIYVNDSDQESWIEGGYGSREEAEAEGKERWALIDPWHDASWELVRIWPKGTFRSNVRMKAALDA